MVIMKNLLLNIAVLTMLASCGELSYKTGAGAADLARDKNMCKTNQSNVELASCLEAKGWAMKNLNEISLFDNLAIKDDTEGVNAVSGVGAHQVLPIEKIELENTTAKSQHTSVTETHQTKESEVLNETQSAETAINIISASQIKEFVKANANDQFKVNSWWKLGAKNNAFSKDSAACYAKLGEEHAPKHALQQYTAAFLICMRDKDWKAAAKAM
jgi:hypothetical protein